MVMKKCAICGEEFDAKGRDLTCGKECSREQCRLLKLVYNPEYYIKNWTKWQEYRKNAEKDKTGTGDLGEKMHKNEDGSLDFEGEMKLIKKEMVRLGIRYPK